MTFRWSFGFLVLLLLACSLPSLSGLGSSAPSATPTPMGDFLTFLLPVYTISLEPGDIVPGTRLRYVESSNSTYNVTIDGLAAVKRPGDSFAWSGVLAPGVSARYNLRLATTLLGQLTAAGPVEITVYNPEPIERPANTNVNASLYFSNAAVQYRVIEGGQIPGTNLTYSGYIDPANTSGQQVAQRMAQLSGTTGYPFVALGDSFTWFGQLRNGCWLRYNLRVAGIDDNGLRLAGTAELWLEP